MTNSNQSLAELAIFINSISMDETNKDKDPERYYNIQFCRKLMQNYFRAFDNVIWNISE